MSSLVAHECRRRHRGRGYVGMPLARVFADAGKSVVLVDVNQDVVDGINRGESHIGDVSSDDPQGARRCRSRLGDHRLRRLEGGRRDPDRAPDSAVHAPRAGPHDRGERSRRDRAAAPQGPGRRARVDDLSGDDREILRPILERSGLKAGRGLPSRVLARARRSGQHRLDDAEHPQGRRRYRRPPAPSGRPSSTARRRDGRAASRRRRRRR